MEETKKIWMDGKLVDWKDAKIHVLTHSLHYGAAVFEGIRFYKTDKGPAVFRLKEHIDRLYKSAEAFKMKIPFSREEMALAVKKTIKSNRISAGYIRPIVYFGYGKMGLNPEGAPVNCAIAVWPWGAYLGDKPVRVKVSRWIRIHPCSTQADAKVCGHYVNSILASIEVKDAGYDEALLLDYKGNVAEGPGENFFIVKGNKIFTPPLGNILQGITRDSIMMIAREMGYKVKEKKLSLRKVMSADEAFFTGTAAEVSPIGSIDGRIIGKGEAGPVTMKLRQAYMDIVNGKNPRYEQWLDLC